MEFTVDLGDFGLYCKKRGNGPLLLLIHGVVCNSDYFDAAAKYLEKDFTVVTYDRRGYTRSPCPEDSDRSMEAQAGDAAAVIRACGGRARVFGHSAGGIIALELANSYPELVEKLMLYEPPVSNAPDYLEKLFEWRDILRKCAKERRTARAMVSFVRRLGGVDPEAPKRSIEEQDRDIRTLPLFLYHEQEYMLGYITDKEREIHLRMPCVIVRGEDDRDGIFHLACEGAAELIGAELISVPGYHNLAADRAEVFAGIVKDVML